MYPKILVRNFAKIIHKLKLKITKLGGITELLFCVVGVKDSERRVRTKELREKEKKIWRMIQGFFFSHFCEIGGVAIIIHKSNESDTTFSWFCEISPK